MKLYHAVAFNQRYMEICLERLSTIKGRVLTCPLLFSFAYPVSLMRLFLYLDRNDLVIHHIMIDSGAFSAWSKGIEIDLEEYAEWVANVATYNRVRSLDCVALDVIPKDKSEREESAKQSFKNYLRMKKLGVDSIPVFHYGETFKWLDKMLEHTNHIGLGGVARLRIDNRQWLDKVFRYLDKQNIRGLKVHGFGQTSVPNLQRYSYFSVDSTSALMAAANARVYAPKFIGEGPYDFRHHWMLDVNEWPRGNGDDDQVLCGPVTRYLHSIGFEYEDIFDHYKRIGINVMFFKNLINQIESVDTNS